MKKLEKLILEQGVWDALKSLTQPFRTAIDSISFDDEKEGERAGEWEDIKNQINEFFSEYPELTPRTKEELDQFDKWMSKNRRKLTRNNIKSLLAKALMNTNINFAKKIHPVITKLINSFKGNIFKNITVDQVESLTKKTLLAAKGDYKKAIVFLFKFLIFKINEYIEEHETTKEQARELVSDKNVALVADIFNLNQSYVKKAMYSTIMNVLNKKQKQNKDKDSEEETGNKAIDNFNNIVKKIVKIEIDQGYDKKQVEGVAGVISKHLKQYIKDNKIDLEQVDVNDKDFLTKVMTELQPKISDAL
jgi:ribosomal protein L17